MRVIVVGAGISGLGAALALQDAGCEVLVLEREGHVGGRMITRSEQGYTWDAGAQIMLPQYREMKRLMARLGLNMVERPRSVVEAECLPGHRLWRQRLQSAMAILRNPAVSPGSKLRMVRVAFEAFRHRRSVEMHRIWKAAALDDESLRTWGDREIGADAVNWWLSLPATSFFFWTPEETPRWLPLTFALLQLNWRVCSPAGGMGAVPEALARIVPVRTGAAVERVRVLQQGGARVSVNGEELQADRVLLALPAPQALALLEHPEAALGAERAAFLRSVRYNRTLTVSAAFAKAPEQRAGGLLFPAGSAGPLASVAWEHLKAPGRAPRGGGLGVMSGYAPQNPSAESMLAALERYYPQRPLFHRTYHWEHAIPIMQPGYVTALGRALAAPPPAGAVVFTCGDSWAFPTTETALADGLRAVSEVLASRRDPGRP
ncbi:MAG TPA: NAD(P)/FAD-dependent oxidoreductase [Symbiobacteriaceae bacterium]|nr:NAD(P)/FAD-dependent oxidoreductase [Symbiobacteriaceae bacterium]